VGLGATAVAATFFDIFCEAEPVSEVVGAANGLVPEVAAGLVAGTGTGLG